MLKKYSIAIPLNNEAYNYAKKIQQKLYDDSAINSILLNNSDPHINIISGSTNNIENIINIARECPFSQPNFTKFFGIGILLTPDPLIFMRFTNSIFLRECQILRNY